MEMVTDHTLIHSYIGPSIHSFVYEGINLSFEITQGRKGGASGYYTLHQFARLFMSYYKLWPICRHKQLNECINIDDMLRAYSRNIRPPQAIGPFLLLPPP